LEGTSPAQQEEDDGEGSSSITVASDGIDPMDPVDPFCATGLYAMTSGVCCPASCGRCGGKACSKLPGGNDCCVSTIAKSTRSCELTRPPCKTDSSQGISFNKWPVGSHPWHELVTTRQGGPCERNNSLDVTQTCIEALYDPYERGSQRITGLTPLPPALEYTLNFDVLFPTGFDFVKGGKLHGLGPGTHVSGCGPMTDTGWSARVMWRAKGILAIYLYHQDKSDNCGHYFYSTKKVTPGQWESISLHMRVNSAATAKDGFVKLYLNGEMIAQALNIRFVDDPKWAFPHGEGKIANFMFNTFHGGSDVSWAPQTPQKAYFDNIAVYPGEQVRQPAEWLTLPTSTVRQRSFTKEQVASYYGEELSCTDPDTTGYEDF